MYNNIGKYIIFIGLILIIIGAIVYFFGDKLSWFGNLPGDVKIEKGRTKIFFPVVTMILVSLILTILINLLRKLF